MNETGQKCARCGATVAPGTLQGICPRCLLALNLEAPTEEAGPGGTQPSRAPLPPGPSPEELARLFPQLEILEPLGRGGMGAVYKARQPKLDRFVALKILLRRDEGASADSTFAERFGREARALARLNHPDIVAVYDYGEAGGYPFLVMEYVDGLTLRQVLQRGKLAPEEALAIVPKICEALQFAHQHGVVHRDIKPENILIDKQGRVKIADFGIAKIVAPGASGAFLTGGKDVIGTPHYMAPEQVEQPAKVDHRADIFSLGVVFYEMLTGELPLGKFPPPSRKVQVDVRLDEIVLHALEKEPARRYQHASEVKSDVETLTSAAAVAAPSVPVAGAGDPRTRLAVGKALGFGFAALCLFIGSLFAEQEGASLLGLLGAAGFLVAAIRQAQRAWWRPAAQQGTDSANAAPQRFPVSLMLLCLVLLLHGLFALLETVLKQGPGLTLFINVVCLVIGIGLMFLWSWARTVALAWVWTSYTLYLGMLFFLVAQGANLVSKGFPTGTQLKIELLGRTVERGTTAALASLLVLACIATLVWTHWLLTRPHIMRLFTPAAKPAGRVRAVFASAALVILGGTLIWAAAPNKRYDTIVTGRVVDAESGKPVNHALVTLASSVTGSPPDASHESVRDQWSLRTKDLAADVSTSRGESQWHDTTDGLGRYKIVAQPRVLLAQSGGHPAPALRLHVEAKGYRRAEVALAQTTPAGYHRHSQDFQLAPLITPEGERGGGRGAAVRNVLEFRRVLEGAETNGLVEWLSASTGTGHAEQLPLARDSVIGGQDIERTRLVEDKYLQTSPESQPNYLLEIQLSAPGATRFAEFTRTHIGRRLAVVFQNKIVSAPVIRSEISSGRANINGRFSLGEALELTGRLNRLAPERQVAGQGTYVPDQPQPLFDLDRGQLLSWPAEVKDWNESRMGQWLDEAGVDLVAAAPGSEPRLQVFALKLSAVGADAWSNPPPYPALVELLSRTNNLPLEPLVEFSDKCQVLKIDKPAPCTYAFYTSEGCVGLLQITETTNRVSFRFKLIPAEAAATRPRDPQKAVALFNQIEDFGHEFDAAFTARNLPAAKTGTARLMTMLTNFNASVQGTGLEFPEGIFGDLARLQQALEDGDWEKVRRAAAHNEEYARAFKRIGARMVELAREAQKPEDEKR